MGSYDDFMYEIFDVLDKKNLKQEFFKQLNKMEYQDKHRYLPLRDRYQYAYNKIIKLHEENKINRESV